MRETRRDVLRHASALVAAVTGAGTAAAQQSPPSYDDGTVYTGGDRVTYDGSVWEAGWWTQGTAPSTDAAVWERVDAADGGGDDSDDSSYPAWDASVAYSGGDRVTHDGSVWEAAWWTKGTEPAADATVWTLVESDDGSGGDEDGAPTAVVGVTPSAPTPGETVTFSGADSSDPDGDALDYEWTIDADTVTGVEHTRSFESAGEYAVSLTITDGSGASDSATTTVSVSEEDGSSPGWDEHPVMAYEFQGAAPADKLTHVIQTFGSVSADGSVSAPWDAGGIDGVTTLLSIGGWKNSQGFPELASDQESRETFASECVALLRDRDLDGIDIDWEFPGPYGPDGLTSYPDDEENFAALIEECRRQFDAAAEEDDTDYYLTAALNHAESHLSGLPHDRLADALDYAKMMTYDMHSPVWVDETNHNSPLYATSGADSDDSIHNTLSYMRDQGWPAEKLVMGLAFYGREFTGVEGTANDGLLQPFEGSGGATGFADIAQQFGDHTRYWDDEAKVPYKFDGTSLLSYDDEESVTVKADYADERGHAIMYWASGHDPNETLLDAVNDALGK
ncbi:glycosyl hydrolase family 18 protein [Halomicrobium sp. HM KBTZ05]|uniref:glycosyl hydrolase family 18 protein n=1 Tax=Halomicrobium sp. HM KBTZ05 TaxID=3242663 RepID=UPI0035587E5C